jgi:preprotein translocase subunit YajC
LIATTQASGSASMLATMIPIIATVAIFYFLVIAPANKQRKKTEQMLNSLKKGDRILTSGGIYGTVQGIENDVVYLKIAENVKIKIARSAIANIVNESSAE